MQCFIGGTDTPVRVATAHVGTAALGRPAERSSASQLCPRRENISVVGLCLARKPALPLPTWGQMSSPPPTWGRPPSAVPPSAARQLRESLDRAQARAREESAPSLALFRYLFTFTW